MKSFDVLKVVMEIILKQVFVNIINESSKVLTPRILENSFVETRNKK